MQIQIKTQAGEYSKTVTIDTDSDEEQSIELPSPTLEKTKELNPSEAIMAFLAWITTRPEEVSFGANNECSIAVELHKEFCGANEFPEVRDGFNRLFVMPKSDTNNDDLPINSELDEEYVQSLCTCGGKV